MSKQSQKEAVYTAVVNVTGFKGEGQCVPTKEQRAQICSILIEGFKAGKIELDREYTESELRSYVSGLLSNWLRKDKRLNGGIQYTAKNPGSRTGASDPQLKALKALLTTLTDPSERAEVQGYIDARLKELQAQKVKVEVDFSLLPKELAEKFSK